MLKSFPPFPAPHPILHGSPLESPSALPSPPSSASSSPDPSTPGTPLSPSSSYDERRVRSRSRSSARRSVPPHTRILKHGSSTTPSASQASSRPHSPPTTPPSESLSASIASLQDSIVQEDEDISSTSSVPSRKGSLREHHYEDAVRIACGAWGDVRSRKKSVTWDKDIAS